MTADSDDEGDDGTEVDLDGRVFRSLENDAGGSVDARTTFEFAQSGDLVHARYAGGEIRLGFLVGLREGETLRFRYAQVTTDGETATGRSTDEVEVLEDGRVRLHETWSWDSKPGRGTGVLEEVDP